MFVDFGNKGDNSGIPVGKIGFTIEDILNGQRDLVSNGIPSVLEKRTVKSSGPGVLK